MSRWWIVIIGCWVSWANAVAPDVTSLPVQDVRNGTPVITQLSLAELIPGDHRFYFRSIEDRLGHPLEVPIRVVKGNDKGPVMMVMAGVYGDEAESLLMVHRYLDWLKSHEFDGTVVAVNGLNIPGLSSLSHLYPGDGRQIPSVSLNRLFPGRRDHVYPAGRFVFEFWSAVIEPNVDYLIEVHGASSDRVSPYYVFADFRDKRNKELARLLQPEIIKVDKGSLGTAETAFVKTGRPALTIVMGGDKIDRAKTVERVLHGLKNVSYHLELVAGHPEFAKEYKTLETNEMVTLRATSGGIVQYLVEPNMDLEEGYLLAIQFDVFGNVVEKYTAPISGRVMVVSGRSAIAAGEPVVRLARKNKDNTCQFGC